jgi:uncharacterized protein (DUF1778 family)
MTAAETPAFRKGGRPRKDPMTLRAEFVRARVSAEEYALIEQRAAEANATLSDYARNQLLHGRVVVRQCQTFAAIDRQDLARIGSNLNQIARICNQTGDSVRARNIECVLDDLRTLLIRLHAVGRPNELGQG